jgi:tetratricopeptide (TPR) repeat protein
VSRDLSTRETARILGLREAQVREMVRSGLCRPARRGRRYAFSFRDLVVLQAAAELVRQKVPAARVRRALARLLSELPEGRSLAGLRVFTDGRHVAVREGRTAWRADTGQTLLNFEVDELAERVRKLHAPPLAKVDAADPAARAERELERALELEDEDPAAACDAYRRALRWSPDLVDAYVNLGRLLHESGDASEAQRLYHLALERSPEDPVIHFNLALALEDTSGAARAIEHYERALALDPGFADAHFNVAGLYEQLGRKADALRHYGAYKKLDAG